jgi:hypothetical protein
MKGFIWNSDGFGDPAKHLAIKEAMREFNLDFVVISETGRGSFSAPFLANLAAGWTTAGIACLLGVDLGASSLASTMRR